jgi:predicted nucleotidyltransferase
MSEPVVLGIVAEYDPFHKGHAYHLETARKLSGAEYVVCVLSGGFTQRGEPAALEKYIRAKTAVQSGADLVVELPFAFAGSGAENFARGGVRLLASLGVNALSFGCESADLGLLSEAADALLCESDSFRAALGAGLGEGLSYAAALQGAVRASAGDEAAALLDGPNNILALEYIKEVKRLGIDGRVGLFPVERLGAGWGEAGDGFAGAGAIRRMLACGEFERAVSFVPEKTAAALGEIAKAAGAVAPSARRLLFPEVVFSYFLATLSVSSLDSLAEVFGMDEGLEHRLPELAANAGARDYESYLGVLPTKRYSEARLKRLMLHTILHVRRAEMERALAEPICSRVLAFGAKGRELLGRAGKTEGREMPGGFSAPLFIGNSRALTAANAVSPVQLELQLRADRFAHLLRSGALAGFIRTPAPLSL